MIQPYSGTKTYRREQRSKLRSIIGNSRDDAPNIAQVAVAAINLDNLARNASAGRFEVCIVDTLTELIHIPRAAVDIVRDVGFDPYA